MKSCPSASDVALQRQRCSEVLEAAIKPPGDWKVGVEYEKFAFRLEDERPAPFEGARSSISALLHRAVDRRFEPEHSQGILIGAQQGDEKISLEPGGQVEYASAPRTRLGDLAEDTRRHHDFLLGIAGSEGLGLLPLGFAPAWTLGQMARVPLSRFDIMRNYMPRCGRLGLDMMHRSCSVQASFDYGSERDMVRKLRVGLCFQPLVTALTANSPFREGRPSGVLSTRADAWFHTDPDRCGIPAFVFQDDMGFERYVDWVIRTPLYSIVRGGEHLDLTDRSLAELMETGAYQPGVEDFRLQLNAMSPEARLKNVIEMRGADAGTLEECMAVAAFWTGLLYDEAALDFAHDIAMRTTDRDRVDFWRQAINGGLEARLAGTPALELAEQLVAKSRAGLEGRGQGEAALLLPIERTINEGRSPAVVLLDHFEGSWGGDLSPLYAAARLT